MQNKWQVAADLAHAYVVITHIYTAFEMVAGNHQK